MIRYFIELWKGNEMNATQATALIEKNIKASARELYLAVQEVCEVLDHGTTIHEGSCFHETLAAALNKARGE
jgi:hypothetical protein